eukprot:jgi/Astpho2/9753/fgenesh1_pg.00149_%23_34_t
MASASVQHGQADLLQHGDGEGINEPAVASDGAPNTVLEQRQPKKASRATEPVSDPAQNGDTHASEDGLSSDRGAAEDEPEAKAVEPWQRRLYFVRLPKPQQDDHSTELRQLEQELEAFKTQTQLLNESINIRKMARENARANVAEARRNFHEARDGEQAKLAEMEPLRKAKAGDPSRVPLTQLAEFKDLMVKTEAELDQLVVDMEYRLNHESIPLNEEKQMVRDIKRLHSQRPRVRQFEAMAAEQEQTRAAARAAPQAGPTLGEMEQERKLLKEEKELKRQILGKYEAEADDLDAKVSKAIEERRRVKELQDECYQRLRETQKLSRSKANDYYDNRRFSQKVRAAVRAGDLEGARDMCSEQVGDAIGELARSPALCASYFEQWEQQRARPFSVGLDDGFDDMAAPDGSSKGARAGKGAKRSGQPPVEPGKSRAQMIIAAALNEAKEELSRSKSNALPSAPSGSAGQDEGGGASASGLASRASSNGEEPSAGATGSAGSAATGTYVPQQKAAANVVPGADPAAPPAAKPPRQAKRQAPVVVPEVDKAEPFVPPPRPKPRAEEAADPRQQQQEAQDEAARRKQRATERREKDRLKRQAKAATFKAKQAAELVAQAATCGCPVICLPF